MKRGEGQMRRSGILLVLTMALAVVFMISLQVKTLYAEKVGGGEIKFTDTDKLPPVIFSHEIHQKAKLQCTDCHTKIFEFKIGAATAKDKKALSMDNLKAGKYCGVCHNGKKAFAVSGDCMKCHSGK
jgi:c(7)-type cytochrome triheme protein